MRLLTVLEYNSPKINDYNALIVGDVFGRFGGGLGLCLDDVFFAGVNMFGTSSLFRDVSRFPDSVRAGI